MHPWLQSFVSCFLYCESGRAAWDVNWKYVTKLLCVCRGTLKHSMFPSWNCWIFVSLGQSIASVTPSRVNDSIKTEALIASWKGLTPPVPWPRAKFTVSPVTSSKFVPSAPARRSRGRTSELTTHWQMQNKSHVQAALARSPCWSRQLQRWRYRTAVSGIHPLIRVRQQCNCSL